MKVWRVASLVTLVFVTACGGTEELALNPIPNRGEGGSAVNASAGAGGNAIGVGSGGAAAGTTSSSGGSGGTSQAGQAATLCSSDLQCSAPRSRCAIDGSCVACRSDDDCPLDSAPLCDGRGRCVACVDNDGCGDGQRCDALTGTCQTCAPAVGVGAGGANSEGGAP